VINEKQKDVSFLKSNLYEKLETISEKQKEFSFFKKDLQEKFETISKKQKEVPKNQITTEMSEIKQNIKSLE